LFGELSSTMHLSYLHMLSLTRYSSPV
jgi:hypothetical protein